MTRRREVWKRLLLLPPIAVGIVVLVMQISGRNTPERAEPQEIARPVRVIEATPARFVPRALGYGFAQPGTVWEAVAEIPGRIVDRHPGLERGRVLPAGTLILRIDPRDYELAVARSQANVESIEAQLDELDIRQSNIAASMQIEQRGLALTQEDLTRKRRLLANGNTSQASVDDAESAVLTQRQRVQDLDNQLTLLPAERRVLEASLALNRSQLAEAETDLARTEIRLPFDARIAELTAEKDQFVATGQTMAVADSIDVAEVTAQVSIDRLMPLIRDTIDLSTITAEQMSDLPNRWGLQATVRLKIGDLESSWSGRLDRISDTIDPKTRTIGLIVAVEEPYRQARPGIRPPLTKNMFVEVEVRGEPRDGVIVVPRVAVHRGPVGEAVVYAVGEDSRLVFRPIRRGPAQDDFVVVESGLAPGDRVVVTDLGPAIEGMLVQPAVDEALAARLLAEAGGAVPVR